MSLISPEAKTSQDVSQIRRAYKVALDAARRLKNGDKTDIFSTQQKQLRQKLRDNVRRCILASPEEYGSMKIEDTAWKYTLHTIVQKLKRDYRGSKSERTQENIRTFLDASYGWYTSFMFQLLDKLNQNGGAENIHFDWWTPEKDNDEDSDDSDASGDKIKLNTILLNLCYKCLLYLGDICRYGSDLLPAYYNTKLPYRYYMQAWHLYPNFGMPWNQIGSLMSNKYHGVFALFFYRRCLQCETPYSDCFQNLKRMLDKAKKSYQSYPRNQMDNLSLDASSQEKKQAVYWFCVVFLHLNGMLHPVTYCTERELNTGCRRMLDLLDLCMYFEDEGELTNEPENHENMPGFIKRAVINIDGPEYLQSSMMVVVFATMIQNFDELRKQKSNRLKAANALFVAAADHVVNHAIQMTRDCIRLEPVERPSEDSSSTLFNSGSLLQHNEMKPSKKSSPPKTMMRRRGGLDDDLSEGESDLSEVSEEEDEICYSTDSASTFSQEMDSDDDTKVPRPVAARNTNNNTNVPKDTPETIMEEEESDESTSKSSLETRKLACTFMTVNGSGDAVEDDVHQKSVTPVDSEDDANEEMVFEFEDGQVPEEPNEEIGIEEEVEELIDYEQLAKLFSRFNLLSCIKIICDWLIVNPDIVGETTSSPLWARLVQINNIIDIEQLVAAKGDVKDETVALTSGDQWIQPYSLWEDRFLNGIPVMAECHEHVDFKTDPKVTKWEENLFRFSSIKKLLIHLSEKHPNTGITVTNEGISGREIKEIDDEFNIRGTFYDQNGETGEAVGQYVIPTPEALCNNISLLKEINEKPRLTTIVTNITIDGLDMLKKDSKEAREVTKWLDIVFSRCDGNLKSMQQTEQRNIQRLRRQDYQAWVLHHLVSQGTKLQRQRKHVILLVDSVDSRTSPDVKKALSMASANNLQIQTVEEFVRLNEKTGTN